MKTDTPTSDSNPSGAGGVPFASFTINEVDDNPPTPGGFLSPGGAGGTPRPTTGRSSVGSALTVPSFVTQAETGSSGGQCKLVEINQVFVETNCCGPVGDKKFCTKPKSGCSTKAHGVPVNLQLGVCHVCYPGKQQALLNPVLPLSCLGPGDDLQLLMENLHSESDLVSFVLEKNPSAAGDLSAQLPTMKKVDHEEFDKLEELVETVIAFGSPSPMGTDQDNSDSGLTGFQVPIDGIGSGDLRAVIAELRAVLEQHNTGLSITKSNMAKLGESHQALLDRLKEEAKKITDLKTDSDYVWQTLGHRPLGFAPNVTKGDVWSVLVHLEKVQGGMATDIERFDKELGSCNRWMTQQDGTMKVLSDAMAKFATSLNNTNTIVQRELQARRALEARVVALESGSSTAPSPFNVSSLGGPQAAPGALQLEVDSLKSLVSNLQGDITSLNAGLQGGTFLPPDLLTQVNALEATCTTLKEKLVGSSNTYDFEGHTFTSADDVLTILGKSLDDISIGCYLDSFSAICKCEDSFDGSKEWAQKQANAKKVSMHPLEVDLMATLPYVVPIHLFAKTSGKRDLMDEEEGFGAPFKTYDIFCGKGRSVSGRQTLKDKIRDMISGIRGVINQSPGNGLAKQLALHLLREVASQIDEIISFIGDYYEELFLLCDHTKEVSWKFVGNCNYAIHKETSHPRIQVAQLIDIGEPKVKAQIIWALLQSHAILNRIIKAKFKSDPVITTTMSNFIMKNRVDKSAFTDWTTKITQATKKMDALDGEVRPLKSTVQEHTKQITNLQKTKQDKK